MVASQSGIHHTPRRTPPQIQLRGHQEVGTLWLDTPRCVVQTGQPDQILDSARLRLWRADR